MPFKSKEAQRAWQQEYYQRTKEAHRARAEKWAKENPERIKEIQKAATKKWKEANPGRAAEIHSAYHFRNKAKRKEKDRRWRKNNPEASRARVSARNKRVRQATPDWLSKKHYQEIKDIYRLAQDLQWLSEEKLHVDHIEPIKGKHVCGLHVPWNLRIIGASANIKKRNNSENHRPIELFPCGKRREQKPAA